MRFRTKVVILLVSVLLSLVGFNIIATSSSFDLLRVKKAIECTFSLDHPVKQETTSHYSISS